METIGAFAAKTRLSELLERTEGGEVFLITNHGRPVATLSPACRQSSEDVAEAIAQLRSFRGRIKASLDDVLETKHEGLRY